VFERAFALTDALDDHVETGSRNADHVANSMPNTTVVPRDCGAGAAPVAIASGYGAEDKCKRRHQDRPQPQLRALQRAVDDEAPRSCASFANSTIRIAFFVRQSDQHDEPICA